MSDEIKSSMRKIRDNLWVAHKNKLIIKRLMGEVNFSVPYQNLIKHVYISLIHESIIVICRVHQGDNKKTFLSVFKKLQIISDSNTVFDLYNDYKSFRSSEEISKVKDFRDAYLAHSANDNNLENKYKIDNLYLSVIFNALTETTEYFERLNALPECKVDNNFQLNEFEQELDILIRKIKD